MHDLSPTTSLSRWLAAFDDALAQRDIAAVAALFARECYWRDLVAFTWNIITVEGRDGVAAMLAATLPHLRPTGWRQAGEATVAGGVTEGWFTFETRAAR